MTNPNPVPIQSTFLTYKYIHFYFKKHYTTLHSLPIPSHSANPENKMLTKISTVSALLFVFLLFVELPPTFSVEAGSAANDGLGSVKSAAEIKPSKLVADFCSQRKRRADRDFCYKVLVSDPKGNSATNNVGLLLVSVDKALSAANSTKGFLATTAGSKDASKRLVAALRDCGTAYNWCMSELKIIPKELEGDPALASYDAMVAGDALDSCRRSLAAGKIDDRSIWSRHNLVTAHVRLCVDIANKI